MQVFSSSAPIPQWRYIPVRENFIINVKTSRIALRSQLGFIGTDFQGSFSWDAGQHALDFGFDHLLLSVFSFKKLFKLRVPNKVYTWFYTRDGVACTRSSEGGLAMLRLDTRGHPTREDMEK